MLAAGRSARRGSISSKLDQVSASGIRRFFELIDTTDGVISLGVGEPDFSTPNHISQAAIRSIEQGETAYTSNFGLMELRELITNQLSRLYGATYDPQNEVIVTTGVSEALNLATQALLDEGDEVISTDPSYVAYMPTVVFAGGKFVTVPVKAEDGFQLQPDALEAAITPSTKAVLLGYPANPTGATMSRAALEAIAEVVERHDLYVISDEIYDRLVYGVEHVSFPSLPRMKERTILLGGFSKAYAMTGWRLGYVCAPPLIHGRDDARPPVHHDVGPHGRAVRRGRSASQRRGRRAGDARRIQPPPPARDQGLSRHGP